MIELKGKDMKTLSYCLTVILLCLSCHAVKAQDLEGVDFGDALTKEQVIAKFGQPNEYTKVIYSEGEDEVYETYIYENNRLEFRDSHFFQFYISSKNFAVFTKDIDGGIRVGDSLEKVLNSDLKPHYSAWYDEDTYHQYYYDLRIYYRIKDGIIVEIWTTFPV